MTKLHFVQFRDIVTAKLQLGLRLRRTDEFRECRLTDVAVSVLRKESKKKNLRKNKGLRLRRQIELCGL